MAKKVLILSSSPRRGGNSDLLCDRFMAGAQQAGHDVEKIFLRDKKINYCTGCGVCYGGAKPCPQRDDAAEVVGKMIGAEVIVMATPVYFYTLCAQMKTLIDRTCARYTEMGGKEFYFILTAAEESVEMKSGVSFTASELGRRVKSKECLRWTKSMSWAAGCKPKIENKMKRIVLIAIMTMFLPDMNTQAQTASGTKVLVAYFSHSGNTRAMARQIAEATGGDLFEIVPAAAYPAEYGAVVDQAKKEIGGGVRPALKGRLPDVGAYDVIFVGSPCWWSTVAPPVATFLADCDWAGKTVVPFMTHEGSRMGRSEEDIRKLCAGATLLGGLPLRGGAVKDSRDVVRKWVQGLNLTK